MFALTVLQLLVLIVGGLESFLGLPVSLSLSFVLQVTFPRENLQCACKYTVDHKFNNTGLWQNGPR